MTRAALAVALLLAVVASPVAGVVAPVAAATPDGSSETAAASQADAVRITGFAAPDEAARGERISVTATVENTGDRTTSVIDYTYDVALYDADGNELQGSGMSASAVGSELGPGERTDVTLTPMFDGSPEDVARYELSLTCEGSLADGVYCG